MKKNKKEKNLIKKKRKESRILISLLTFKLEIVCHSLATKYLHSYLYVGPSRTWGDDFEPAQPGWGCMQHSILKPNQ